MDRETFYRRTAPEVIDSRRTLVFEGLAGDLLHRVFVGHRRDEDSGNGIYRVLIADTDASNNRFLVEKDVPPKDMRLEGSPPFPSSLSVGRYTIQLARQRGRFPRASRGVLIVGKTPYEIMPEA